jgi:hypothetical protein
MAAKAHDYRRYAQECLEATSRLHGEEERSILLHIDRPGSVWPIRKKSALVALLSRQLHNNSSRSSLT